MSRPTKERLAQLRARACCPAAAELFAEIDTLIAERDAAIKSSWDVGASWEEAREAIATLTVERDEARSIAIRAHSDLRAISSRSVRSRAESEIVASWNALHEAEQ